MNKTYHTPYGDILLSKDFEKTDMATIDEIIARDCYRVIELKADGFTPKVILDVGAQHGVFTFLCGKLWPEARIYAFEPVLNYFRTLVLNCPNSAVPINLPVFGFPVSPSNELHEDQQWWRDSGDCLSADFLADRAGLPGSRSTLLKLDTEGAETNILRALSGGMDRFTVVTGEWHHSEAKEVVRRVLAGTHEVTINDGGDWNNFFARRKP